MGSNPSSLKANHRIDRRALWSNQLVNGSRGFIELLGEISDRLFVGLSRRLGYTSCAVSRVSCCRRQRNEVRLRSNITVLLPMITALTVIIIAGEVYPFDNLSIKIAVLG